MSSDLEAKTPYAIQHVDHVNGDKLTNTTSSARAEEESMWECVKNNKMVILYSLASGLSAMLWGYDIGVNTITTALPGFKLVFGYVYKGELLIAAHWNALWTAMTSAGMLVGGIACGYISDKLGRRIGLGIGAILSIVGVAVQYISATPGVLLVGKIINGFALGFFLTMGPIYASEIAPLRLRSTLVAMVSFFITAGQLTAIGIGNNRFPIMTPDSYKVLFASQWGFSGVLLLFAAIIPESPWYLVKRGKYEQAKASLRRLRSKTYNCDTGVAELQAAIAIEEQEAQNQRSATYMDCFRGSNFRRTRIACGMFFVQQFTGIAFYSQVLYFLGISGIAIALTFKLALVGFGIGMAANMASWFIMQYVGRRKLLLVGIVMQFVILISLGFASLSTASSAMLYVAIMMNIVQLFYGPTIGAPSWVLSAEISAGQMRAKTQSLCTMTNALVSWTFSFITPYLINTDQANLGAKTGFFFAGFCVIGLAWVWFEVPESKDRPYAVLDELFARNTPTRKFATTDVDELTEPTK